MVSHQAKRQARVDRIAGRVQRREAARAEVFRRNEELDAEHRAWVERLLDWIKAHPGLNPFESRRWYTTQG